MEYQYSKLSNGIRLIHKMADSPVAHCGIIINAGSRDEVPQESGVAHFIEHVIFKGTNKRKAWHVISRLEDVGGDLNAYTSKEETFVYASFLSRYYERSLELFADIIFNSSFPEKELEKEKDVIIDEINSYLDSPAELIFDEFEEVLFNNHPIGHNILGSPETVKSFGRQHIQSFMQRNYLTDRMVICSVGKLDFNRLIFLCEKHFGHIPASGRKSERLPFTGYQPSVIQAAKSNFQTHCILGNIAYDISNDRKTTLALLTNILGGPGMNSRLNMAIREKHGYSYNIEAHYQPYCDTGIFNIYLGTDTDFIEKSLKLVYKELKTLRETELGTLQLHKSKQQIIGQIAISLESNIAEMISIGKSHLFYETVDTMVDMIKKIEGISSKDLIGVANEIFVPDQFSMLTYLPKQE
jgi:predicted Zn-dependent peptidase